jgi:hypothetical protein
MPSPNPLGSRRLSLSPPQAAKWLAFPPKSHHAINNMLCAPLITAHFLSVPCYFLTFHRWFPWVFFKNATSKHSTHPTCDSTSHPCSSRSARTYILLDHCSSAKTFIYIALLWNLKWVPSRSRAESYFQKNYYLMVWYRCFTSVIFQV